MSHLDCSSTHWHTAAARQWATAGHETSRALQVGVDDDGTLRGISEAEMKLSLDTLSRFPPPRRTSSPQIGHAHGSKTPQLCPTDHIVSTT